MIGPWANARTTCKTRRWVHCELMRGRVVVVAGPPLAGKSTLSKALSDQLGALLLSTDQLREVIFPEGSHSAEERDACYRAMHWLTGCLAPSGMTVVLDATYGRQEHRDGLEELISQTGLQLVLIQCRVSPEEALRRLVRRRADHPARDLTPQRVASLVASYRFSGCGLVLDGERPIDAILTQALGFVLSGLPRVASGDALGDSCDR